MRARDQSSIFSTGGKFCPDYGLVLELHALTRSYALLSPLGGCCANGKVISLKIKTLYGDIFLNACFPKVY